MSYQVSQEVKQSAIDKFVGHPEITRGMDFQDVMTEEEFKWFCNPRTLSTGRLVPTPQDNGLNEWPRARKPFNMHTTGGNGWGTVADSKGNQRAIAPFSWALDKDDYDEYDKWKRGDDTKKSGTKRATRTSDVPSWMPTPMSREEYIELATSVRAYMRRIKERVDNLDEWQVNMNNLDKIAPIPKNQVLLDLFGVGTQDELETLGPVNMAYVMWRGPSGEFSVDHMVNKRDLPDDWDVKYKRSEVKQMVERLKLEGINVEAQIVDLN